MVTKRLIKTNDKVEIVKNVGSEGYDFLTGKKGSVMYAGHAGVVVTVDGKPYTCQDRELKFIERGEKHPLDTDDEYIEID